jgi:hypothetical protein
VIEQAFAEAVRRDPHQQLRWVVLTDGQEDLLRQVCAAAKRYKVDVIVVQDFVHVLEYLWKAAYALHPEHAEEREGWVMDRATAVLHGRAWDVAVGLRRAATRKQLSQGERKAVDKAADYLENNRERLQYDRALTQGLPIATGVIEGACRHLVKDRMDITGARWGLVAVSDRRTRGVVGCCVKWARATQRRRSVAAWALPPMAWIPAFRQE